MGDEIGHLTRLRVRTIVRLRPKHRITCHLGHAAKQGGVSLRAHFGSHVRATGAMAAVAVLALACGGGTTGGTTSKPKIGVVLTYNFPGFWGNYLKYEAQYESELGVTLVGPKVANVEANGNEAAQQILDVTSLNARDRAAGCTQAISSQYSNFKVKAYETKDWGTDPAVQNATTALTAISDLRGIYVHWSVPEDGIIAQMKQKGKYSDVGAANHIMLVGNDGSPHECDLIRAKSLDATIDQPADKYAYYAIYYAKQAIAGTKYADGQSTDHSSKIVTVQGNLEDALAAPLVTLAGDTGSTQVNSTDLWCNSK